MFSSICMSPKTLHTFFKSLHSSSKTLRMSARMLRISLKLWIRSPKMFYTLIKRDVFYISWERCYFHLSKSDCSLEHPFNVT